MDGLFSKIIYSNEVFSLNCIYLYLPFEIQGIERQGSKNVAKLLVDSSNNNLLIQELTKIETRIIEYFKQTNSNKSNKIAIVSIQKQLSGGVIKLYKDYSTNREEPVVPKFLLKISGVWETNTEIGLTFKIIETLNHKGL